MKNLLVIILLFICFCMIAILMQINNGRYEIYIHPVVRADQYLLDTKTGRTWQITQESKEKYIFWHEIPRDELPPYQNTQDSK